jgi:hypothetical protein
MNRKAFIGDTLYFAVFLFVFFITVVIAYFVLSNINTSMQADSSVPIESKNILDKFTTRFKASQDWGAVTLLIGFLIAIVISAFVLRTYPALGIIMIVIMVIFVGIALRFSNAFHSFATSDNMVSTSSQFTIIPNIMNNLPKILLVVTTIFIIILFSKGKNRGLI